jgi:hypothetical protein
MLWLVIKGSSHQIISCNIAIVDLTGNGVKDTYQLWVERPNGKSLKIIESRDEKDIQEVKDAIDFAIKSGHPSLELE